MVRHFTTTGHFTRKRIHEMESLKWNLIWNSSSETGGRIIHGEMAYGLYEMAAHIDVSDHKIHGMDF